MYQMSTTRDLVAYACSLKTDNSIKLLNVMRETGTDITSLPTICRNVEILQSVNLDWKNLDVREFTAEAWSCLQSDTRSRTFCRELRDRDLDYVRQCIALGDDERAEAIVRHYMNVNGDELHLWIDATKNSKYLRDIMHVS